MEDSSFSLLWAWVHPFSDREDPGARFWENLYREGVNLFMKKYIVSLFVVGTLAMIVFATALPGWGASHTRSLSAEKQFHVAPKKGVSPAYDRIHAGMASAEAAGQERDLAKMGILPAANGKPVAAGKLKPHRNSPTGGSTVGFVAATQIPAGGYMSSNTVLTGDFNGDGKTDLVTVVSTSSSVISIAASIGNGDGTFGAPQMTAIPPTAVTRSWWAM